MRLSVYRLHIPFTDSPGQRGRHCPMCSPILRCGRRLQLDQAFKRAQRQEHSLLFPHPLLPESACIHSSAPQGCGSQSYSTFPAFGVAVLSQCLTHCSGLRQSFGGTQFGPSWLPFRILLLSSVFMFLSVTCVVSQARNSLSFSLRALIILP